MPIAGAPNRLSQEQVERISSGLGRAFMGDPFYQYITPNEASREADLKWWMSVLLRYSAKYGTVYTLDDGSPAAALVLGPDATMVSTPKILAMGLYKGPFVLGLKSLFRILDITGQWDKLHQQQPRRHFYLMILGVDPSFQGQGAGKALLKPLLDRADRESLPCYLETASERNLAYYGALGFKIVNETRIDAPEGPWAYWTMLRP
jgi:ribosomal protein S18 acetylase RimI-like enzyme